jgi:hypothetical protein
MPGAVLARDAKKIRATYPVIYEGGSLALRHNKIKARFEGDQVVLAQHGHRVAVPLRDITEISCGNEVHRRVGAAVLNTVPRLRLGEAEIHYVGVAWTDLGAKAPRVEVLFRLNNGNYREFLASLERGTGKKAVDTSRVPTVVHYAL